METQIHDYWSGRTSRASLHAIKRTEASATLIINGLHLAFQSQPFCGAISAILPRNLSYFTAQYG
ncbi:hypothetical protein [Segatella maculosa]|uniref:hypothetical protein n=1 Tax=Segatella maculosa TaxID=439703 RepID=UPI0012B62FA7|nr:hypothetical protein [Segatella maculosa]